MVFSQTELRGTVDGGAKGRPRAAPSSMASKPPPLMKKHSQTDLVSRLKTRKILGVGGEDDDGEVHRSKISQMLGNEIKFAVREPVGLRVWILISAVVFTSMALMALAFPNQLYEVVFEEELSATSISIRLLSGGPRVSRTASRNNRVTASKDCQTSARSAKGPQRHCGKRRAHGWALEVWEKSMPRDGALSLTCLIIHKPVRVSPRRQTPLTGIYEGTPQLFPPSLRGLEMAAINEQQSRGGRGAGWGLVEWERGEAADWLRWKDLANDW
ncbi:hypothetical protein JZ751_008162 [Albula glossodonta]|uniref:Tumor protein p53-inducible protein 11 n=1 Tax=Albula glossodonta TaxID=121402 RepID=A0A8T2N9Q3_9TELE|nr:hypothetical protein JZ751_008162 [Albula glossodonta]